MTPPAYRLATLADFVGEQIGLSEWVEVRQPRIDAFADCTGDRQWIHVDVDRARREGPWGAPIAHGYLSLSLAASLAIDAGAIPVDATAALNYGLNKVRFVAPVRAGARVRNRVVLQAVEARPQGRVLITLQNTLEIEGEVQPALVAESLALLMGAEAR